jgi:cysteine desulfurase / selenocysteine lyase
MDAIAEHEHELLSYAIPLMMSVPRLKIYGPGRADRLRGKVGVIAFELEHVPHAKVAAILSVEGGIGVRNGCFCAHPYVKRLLRFEEEASKTITNEILSGDRTNLPGMVRASFGCYNSFEDVDRFVEMLRIISAGEYKGEYVLEKSSGSYWPANFTYPFHDYFPHFSFRARSVVEGFGEAS